MERSNTVNFTGIGRAGLFVGIVGTIAGVLLGSSDKAGMMQSYLWAWTFWALVVLGCLGLTMLHHTIRATWSLSVVRMLEAGGGPVALAIIALGFIPIAMNLSLLYPWADPAHANDHITHLKAWYLNVDKWWGFFGRQIAYFAIWIVLAFKAQQSSFKQDETLDPTLAVKRQSLGAVGLLTFFVTMTFSITDWVMALELNWYSTVLPLLTCVGAALTALSICVILVLSNRDKEPYASIITPQLTKDLGNMLFTLIMLWQYLVLSQYLITWSGNLQEEIPYYIKRNDFGWAALITANIVFQFFVPFTALLAPRTKRYAKNLLVVAWLLFIMRLGDIYWTVMPSMRGGTLSASASHWADYLLWFGLGGIWLAIFAWQLRKAEILPKHDTRLLEVEHAH